MSSSNLVRVAVIKETTYGTTPGAGNFDTSRFISESLSGTPETTESQQIRTDRMSSGQVVTSLTVGGGLDHELSKDDVLELFMTSAMGEDWNTSSPVTVTLTIDATAKTITRASGDWASDIVKGDMLTLTGSATTANNTQVMVTSVDSALVISFTSVDTVVDSSDTTDYQLCDYLEIGTDQISFSMEKAFTDLTTKAINYTGMIAGEMALNVNYGEIVNGSFTFSGNGYDPVDAAADFMTNARTINDPGTTNSMNGSVDMPFIASDTSGTFDKDSFCIQSVALTVNNNLTPQTCLGTIAPADYSAGTANIGISMSAYLADGNWSMLEDKLAQTPFQFGFAVENAGGFYGFYLPAVQITFDDPASGGQNQDIILSTEGVGKVGALGESALKIFRA